MASSAETLSGTVIKRVHGALQTFSYTACYCEENIHLLASELVRRGYASSVDELFAVFISNPAKQVPLWKQRAGDRKGGEEEGEEEEEGDGSDADTSGGGSDDEGLVVWDYHVVMLQSLPPSRPSGVAAAAVPAAAAIADPEEGYEFVRLMAKGEVMVPLRGGVQGGRRGGTGKDGGGIERDRSGCCSRGLGSTNVAGRGTLAATADTTTAAAAATARASESGVLVWDLDTILPFPCSLELYARRALKSHYMFANVHCRFFRVVPARFYLRHFASDRSHMRRPGGGWKAPPPPYPPLIAADGTTNNIQRYWDMTVQAATQTEAATSEKLLPPGPGSDGSGLDSGGGRTEGGGGGKEEGPRHEAPTARPGCERDGDVSTTAGTTTSAASASPPLPSPLPQSTRMAATTASVSLVSMAVGPYGIVLDERSFLATFGVHGSAAAGP